MPMRSGWCSKIDDVYLVALDNGPISPFYTEKLQLY
jgi:hypothetical protein